MPSMNDSSLPVETSRTRTPATGSLRQAPRQPARVATPVRLSLAPGHDAARADLGEGGRRGERQRACRRCARARAPGSAPAATSSGPPMTGHMSGGRRVACARAGPGSARRRSALGAGEKSTDVCAASWWATTTTVRSASRSPASRDDVPRRARGQQAAAEPLAPAGDVVGDGRGGEGAGGQRGRAAPGQPGAAGQRAAAAPAATSRSRGRAPPRRARRSRPRAGAGDPLGGAALAVGGRGPLERGEVAHDVLELGAQGGVGGHGHRRATI